MGEGSGSNRTNVMTRCVCGHMLIGHDYQSVCRCGDCPCSRFKVAGSVAKGTEDSYGTGAELIAAERQRQIEAEGWTSEHDDAHAEGDLYEAAIAYLMALGEPEGTPPPEEWPWGVEWWKPTVDPIRQLVKAGALIAAEIDRRLRGDSHG